MPMNQFIFYVISSTEQLGWSVQPQRGAVWFSIHLSITVPIPMRLECLLYHFFCFYQIFVFLWCISAKIYFNCHCLCVKNYSIAWQITRLQKKLSPGLCSVLLPAWLIMWCTYVINKYLTNVLWKGSVRAFLHLPTKLGLPQQNHSTFITNFNLLHPC